MSQQLQCPLGECGYTGARRSIEAHISGSTAGDHAGKVGKQFRNAISHSFASDGSEGESTGETSSELEIFGVSWPVLAALVVAVLLLYLVLRDGEDEAVEDESVEDEDVGGVGW